MKKILLTSRMVIADDHGKYIRLRNDYAEAIRRAGGLPIIAQSTEDESVIDEYIKLADAIVFTGGEDIDPNLYGGDFHQSVEFVSFERDAFEKYLYEKAFEKKIPMLGICRGMQMINALSGGDLYQDLQAEYKGASGHSMGRDLSRGILKIFTGKNSKINKILGDEILVNQFHHQAVKNLGDGFVATAHSRDGVIEAMEYTGDQYISCVQFHPESMIDHEEKFLNIFKDLVEIA